MLTPHSYITRLNAFHQRDQNVNTILTPDGLLDPFSKAIGNLVQDATSSGLCISDEFLEAAQDFVSRYGRTLKSIDPKSKALEPIAYSLGGHYSDITWANYHLYLDQGDPVVFPSNTKIYQFVRRFIKGYYPQLRRQK